MKELLFSVTRKDLKIEYFCAGGPGGQHQNKTASACRITHPPSGAVGESREERHQHMNQKIAFRRMVNTHKFMRWLKVVASELLTGESVEEKVDKAMHQRFIKVEVKNDRGIWVSEDKERKENER